MKKTKLLITTLAMSIILGMTAFAGQWQQDGSTWKYQQDDSTYAVNGWQWIDGNGDGTAECYYFDGNGAMLGQNLELSEQKQLLIQHQFKVEKITPFRPAIMNRA